MAVSTNTRFGMGAVVGIPAIAGDFNKFEAHDTPRHQVGWKVEDVDGNVYRYSHFGADVYRGVLVAQDLSESSLGESENVIVASASCTVTTDGYTGYNHLEITAGSSDTASNIAKDQFAGGYFITADDTGEGYTYNIVGNTANAVAGGTIRLQLRQKLQGTSGSVSVGATTDFIIVGNQYANLEIATTATDKFLAGVTCRTMDVSDKPYGWVQTRGTVGALMAGVDVIGESIQLSTETSGAVNGIKDHASSSVNQIIGSCIVAADAGGHGAYSVNLE